MGQQLPHRYRGHATVLQLGAEVGQPFRDGIVQAELASLDESHRRSGYDRLRQRRQPEDPLSAHLGARLTVREPRCAAIRDPAIVRNEHDGADEALFRNRAIDDSIHPAQRRSACFKHLASPENPRPGAQFTPSATPFSPTL